MATARENALAFLKSKWYSEGQIADATANVQKQLDSWKSASSIMNDVKSNSNSYFGWSAMYGNSSSSSSSSNWGSSSSSSSSSSNNNATDVYWDVWGNRSNATPMDFSKTSWAAPTDLAFGKNAYTKQDKDSNYLSNRNTSIASYLYNMNKWANVDREKVSEYLNQFSDFTSNEISQKERDNTIDAILARYGEVKKEREKADLDSISSALKDTNGDGIEDKDGFYNDNWSSYKAYWYDWLSQEYKNLYDRLPDEKKKEFSNLWAKELQRVLKEWDATQREIEQADARQQNRKEVYDINREMTLIQADQTLRNAEQSYENLQQNWQYLGNMWMPGTSATKIKAIWDALTEARTTLDEVRRLTQLRKDAQEKEWEGQVLQYTQQIDNLQYDLVWKIGQEAVNALSKYTAAELEWKLDTIDWVTAFKRELLDELDTNLSGITAASLSQMQYINQQYQDIADKMYEYNQNSNKVNWDMSKVLGYYVDDNWNAILNSEGKPIQVPPTAPMEPVFDKETWRLITFADDGNWWIVASVQQVWNNAISPYVSWMTNWWAGNSWYLDIPRNVNWFKDNVWADTNNFGNITSAVWGSIGMYKSPNGRSYAVFANAQDWYNALVNDLKSKQSWASKTWLNGNSTVEELMWVWVNWSGKVDSSHPYAQRFYAASWLQPGTKIWNASTDALAKGIMAWEWTLAAYQKGWVDLSAYANQWTQWGWQYNQYLIDLFKKSSLAEWDKDWLESQWISLWDFWNMKADYLNSQNEWWAINWQWLWASILDYTYVSDDNNSTQNAAFWFASRAWKADEMIRDLEDKFSATWNWDRWDWLKSNDQKRYEALKWDWIRAWLRKDSWAQISDAEFAQAEQYFPKAWDDKDTIAMKQKLRENVNEWLFQQSWKASDWTRFVEIYRNNKKNRYANSWSNNSQSETVVEEEEDIPEWFIS